MGIVRPQAYGQVELANRLLCEGLLIVREITGVLYIPERPERSRDRSYDLFVLTLIHIRVETQASTNVHREVCSHLRGLGADR